MVLPDGRIWDGLRSLRKDNTGYDLKQLFIGAEGTLGIVTAAVLALQPATPSRATAWVAMSEVADAAALLPVLRRHAGDRLSTWELVSGTARDLVVSHGVHDPLPIGADWFGLVELAGPAGADVDSALEAALDEAAGAGLVLDAVLAGSPGQREGLWALRERISEAQESWGPTIKHDVSVAISALDSLVADLAQRLEQALPGVRPVVYGHVGDGNLHYNLSKPPSWTDAEFTAHAAELSNVVYDATADRGGSISAEHGLGSGKAAAAATYKSDVELDLMRTIKSALDPAGLMNPGKVLT